MYFHQTELFLLQLSTRMATTSASLPEQQQPAGETLMTPEVASSSSSSSSAWHSSGSLGPFFVVMSVLTVLAIISCLLGKRCTKRAASPMESIGDRDFFGWVKRKCRPRCISGDVEIGAKIMGFGKEKNGVNVKDGENQLPPL
ncbi:uncharacterized protein LOC121243202 [Juglans microcarpa x Juglans regia]|uniref:uncharacterized protein LOC121243202 n=1 Tax=Juglans microcarpa x Juglans regia TaxID=2249226 RepID=UPI001B7E4D06|nr:uncharacterized protein LOC121243202 [Juglans microcarpa x Juglans regia]